MPEYVSENARRLWIIEEALDDMETLGDLIETWANDGHARTDFDDIPQWAEKYLKMAARALKLGSATGLVAIEQLEKSVAQLESAKVSEPAGTDTAARQAQGVTDIASNGT